MPYGYKTNAMQGHPTSAPAQCTHAAPSRHLPHSCSPSMPRLQEILLRLNLKKPVEVPWLKFLVDTCSKWSTLPNGSINLGAIEGDYVTTKQAMVRKPSFWRERLSVNRRVARECIDFVKLGNFESHFMQRSTYIGPGGNLPWRTRL